MADTVDTQKQNQSATSSGQASSRPKFDGAAASTRSLADDGAAASTRSLADQALLVGQEITDKAKDLAESSADALKTQASDFVDAAKDVASQATGKLTDAVNDGKSSGAEYVVSLADAMRRASHEFDRELPLAGTYIRKAAEQVEGVSEGIKNGNLNDLVRSAQSFARRQPSAFLGIAVLAGFGVVRFLKSSAEPGSESGNSTSVSSRATNQGYRDDFTN